MTIEGNASINGDIANDGDLLMSGDLNTVVNGNIVNTNELDFDTDVQIGTSPATKWSLTQTQWT